MFVEVCELFIERVDVIYLEVIVQLCCGFLRGFGYSVAVFFSCTCARVLDSVEYLRELFVYLRCPHARHSGGELFCDFSLSRRRNGARLSSEGICLHELSFKEVVALLKAAYLLLLGSEKLTGVAVVCFCRRIYRRIFGVGIDI